MRGLHNFITECLDCQTKEDEKARVNKELANIRKNFAGSSLSGYNRKKYVAKLLYVHLLGYSYDFGFPQMIELVTSKLFSEKQIGYITLGVYLNGNYELITILIQHFLKEIANYEDEPAQCLALSAAANIGGTDIAESCASRIMAVLTSDKSTEFVKKKAALALCRLYRETPNSIVVDENLTKSLTVLLQNDNFGVQLSVSSFIYTLMGRNTATMAPLCNVALQQLNRIFFELSVPLDYIYGRNPVPWLIMRYMRILQFKTEWSQDDISKINRILNICLQKTDLSPSVKEVNSNMILLFESINLIIAAQFSSTYLTKSATILGEFLSAKQANVRYLALETLTRLVSASPDVIPSLDKHKQTLYLALRDPDNSIRRRTLSLLYVLCTKETSEEIVHELLNYLRFADISMREPLCLKIAVLAESFAPDLAWYVDIVIQLITMAGDECHDGVWHRVVQVVSLNPNLQRYATLTAYNSMTAATPHDRLIKLASQLVGDYYQLIQTPPEEIVEQLTAKFKIASDGAKSMILTAMAKVAAKNPNSRATIIEFMGTLKGHQNIDIQQRAIEYSAMLAAADSVLQAIFKPIPAFKAKTSSLLRQVMEEQQEKGPEEEEEAAETPAATGGEKPEEAAPAAAEDEAYVTKLPSKTAEPAGAKAEAVDDLLSIGNTAPAAKKAPVASKGNDLEDLMAIGTPAPGSAQVAPTVAVTKETVYHRFLTQDSGIIYEDQNVTLNLNIQVNGGSALLTFNVTNLAPAVINGVSLYIIPVAFLKTVSKPGTPQIHQGGVGIFQFAVNILSPYNEPPTFNFKYSFADKEVNETIKLPLPVSKFITSYAMDQQTFFARWGALNSPQLEATANYPVPNGDVMVQISTLMTQLLKLPPLQLQLPPNNVCGAGIVSCESGVLGVLARFFVDPATKKVMVSVKGTNTQITNAIQKVLEAYFK